MFFIGCTSNNDIYICNGIPREDLSFSALYFLNKNEGYLFGTLSSYSGLTESDLNNPQFTPKYKEEAVIYKTVDGGYNWEKIDSETDKGYSNISIRDNNFIYIVLKDSKMNFQNNIVKISLPDLKKIKSKNIETISSLWMSKDQVNYSNNRKNLFLFKLSDSLVFNKSLPIPKYILKGISIDAINLGLFADHDSSYLGYIDINNKYHEITLPIIPKDIITLNKEDVFVIGNAKDNDKEIEIVKFNLKSNSLTDITKFSDYSIVKEFYSSDKVMVAFVGNIEGAFITYDLVFSTDKGLTWNVRKLEEDNFVHPSCLIDNILYIYSGGARMQKIVF